MKLIGTILWWDRRDSEGVIVDGVGNQYYFNKSVVTSHSLSKIRDGQFVEFEAHNLVPYVPCARSVCAISARSKRAG